MASISMLGADKSVVELEAELAREQAALDAAIAANRVYMPGSDASSAAIVSRINQEHYASIGREMVTPYDASGKAYTPTKKNDSWVVPAAIAGAALLLGAGFLSAKG